MLSILPASSSPELKAFPLHLRHIRSFGSAPSLPNLPRAARLVRFASQRRDCVIYSVPHSLLSTNPTDSPDSRFNVGALVVPSECLCQSRKDPYLPLEPQCVRLLPRPTGLPPMAFAVSFRIRCRGRENRRQTPQANTHSPLGPHHKCTLISRPTAAHHGYIYIESVRRYSCYFTALLPMCIRLT